MKFDINILLSTVITMFLLILIGYAARKLKIIDDALSKGLSNLVICVGQPFLLMSSLLNVDYSPEKLKTGVFIILLAAGVYVVSIVFGILMSLKFSDIAEKQLFQYGMIFSNSAFYGFPILKAIYGGEGLFWGAFYCIMYNIVTWTWGMFVLSRADSTIKMSVKKMIVNYGTIPCLIGFALYALQIKLPSSILSAMNYMGSICTPISMLIIGGLLATLPLKKLFTNLKVYWLLFTKLLVLPVIVALIARLCGLSDTMVIFAALMAGLPTAANTSVFAERHDIKPEFASLCVGITTLFSVITIPALLYFIKYI